MKRLAVACVWMLLGVPAAPPEDRPAEARPGWKLAGLSAGGAQTVIVGMDGTVLLLGRHAAEPSTDPSLTAAESEPNPQARATRRLGRTVRRVVAGRSHAIALLADGRLMAWGLNSHGQIGDGTSVDRDEPVPIEGPQGAALVALGPGHSLAVDQAGSLWAWGSNAAGQLGLGSNADSSLPARVVGLTGVIGVAAGGGHSLAVSADGAVWSWGANANGQVGDGTTDERTAATRLAGLDGVKAVAAGEAHSLALGNEGAVWAWGHNESGQLGDGTTEDRLAPASILAGVAAIAAGDEHSLALRSDGTVWTWGSNEHGQLGNGTTVGRSRPVRVPGLEAVVAIAAGGSVSLAVTADGTIWGWGENADGQLGAGEAVDRLSPGPVVMPAATVATPTFSPVAGTYTASQTVAISCATSGATIRYTTNGSTPTTSSPTYTAPISITATTTLKAAAWKSGLTMSAVATGTYTLQVATPAFNPVAATYSAAQSVALSTTTPGATLRYTTDGSTPTTSSPTYSTPISVTQTTAIKAIGFKTGWANSATASGTFTLQVATPTMAPVAGTYNAPQSVALSTTSAGATIRFTTNGSTPTSSSPAYTAPISVTQTTTIKAIGFKSGWSNSATASGTFTLQAATPAMSPPAGTYAAPQSVALSTSTAGATVRYTTDGSTPTATSPVYSTPIAVSGTTTIKAIAILSGWTTSTVASAAYAFQVATPTMAPTAGTYTTPQTVTLSTASPGATIRYTTNGTTPTGSSPVYTGPFAVNATTTVSAIGLRTGWSNSTVAVGVYQMSAAAPVFSPAPGTYPGSQSVTLTSASPGVTIRYTTDGSNPTPASASYTGPILVSVTSTLKAAAFASGWTTSPVSTGTYTIVQPLAPPVLTPGAGVTIDSVTVSMAAESGATIRFTTDGSDPTSSSAIYASPVPLTTSTTLKARAFAPGRPDSPVSSATYTVKMAAPTFSPGAGAYLAGQQISITGTSPGATLHYTTNGNDPTEADPVIASGGTIAAGTFRLKASAWKAGCATSDVQVADYSVAAPGSTLPAPTFSPPAGTYPSARWVTISTAAPTGLIRYTLDGSDPTEQDAVYSGPIFVDGPATLKARVYAPDYVQSPSATAAYAIGGSAVATPVFSPASRFLVTATQVRVTSATAGAALHYTTDGLDPTEADPSVASGGSVLVDQAMVLKARAFLGGATSGVRQAAFVLSGAVTGGTLHSLALDPDGTLWAWGRNYSGQLGDGTTIDRSLVQVLVPPGIVAVAAQGDHSLALGADGTVWAWGANEWGQVGNGSTSTQPTPVALGGLSTVIGIACAQNSNLAVKADGTVWAWGWGTLVPTRVDGVTGAVAVANGFNHSLALQADGRVWSWGDNSWGQLGNGQAVSGWFLPALVPGLTGVSRIVAGDSFSAALKTDGLGEGTVYSWGSNQYSALGIPGLSYASVPTPTLSGVELLASGTRHALAAKADGSTWSWGWGYGGQIGDGTTLDRPYPVRVNGIRDVLAIGAGHASSLAVDANGQVWFWGSGGSPLPTAVAGLDLTSDAWAPGDDDGDGLPNAEEIRYGCNAEAADTNGDGIRDGVAIGIGLSCSKSDMDGDGLANADEIARGTDPFRADTDGDGAGDAVDCFPLDPTRQCPPSNPADTTPPVITLLEPANAVPVP